MGACVCERVCVSWGINVSYIIIVMWFINSDRILVETNLNWTKVVNKFINDKSLLITASIFNRKFKSGKYWNLFGFPEPIARSYWLLNCDDWNQSVVSIANRKWSVRLWAETPATPTNSLRWWLISNALIGRPVSLQCRRSFLTIFLSEGDILPLSGI